MGNGGDKEEEKNTFTKLYDLEVNAKTKKYIIIVVIFRPSYSIVIIIDRSFYLSEIEKLIILNQKCKVSQYKRYLLDMEFDNILNGNYLLKKDYNFYNHVAVNQVCYIICTKLIKVPQLLANVLLFV